MVLNIILIVLGIAGILYSRVFTVHRSTGRAMGALLLKFLTAFFGTIAIMVGIARIIGF